MPIPTEQIVVLVAVIAALGYGYYQFGSKVGAVLRKRFIYGIPWGSLLTIVGVVGFYLFAQSGIESWNNPVIVAFRSWSYFYPTGMLAAGFAHAGPAHLIGNMAGTVVLAPIAEYFWGHYPSGHSSKTRDLTDVTATDHLPDGGWINRPWIRALVIFPIVMILVSLATSFLALGWSLGFSGTVFALAGFAVVRYPLSTIVGLAGISTVSTLATTLTQPVLRVTAEPGAPGPPGWAGVNVQAHLVGFLIGAVLACYLVWARDTRPPVERLFAGILLFAFAQSLWVIALSPSADVYVMYRWIGVAFVLLLSVALTTLVIANDEPIPRLLSRFERVPSRQQLAWTWLFLLTVVALLGIWGIIEGGSGTGGDLVLLVLFWALLAAPAIAPLAPDRVASTPLSQRQAVLFVILCLGVLVVIPSVFSNIPVLDEDPVPEEGTIEVGDYHIGYVENKAVPRISGISAFPDSNWGSSNGVVVVSEQREIWTESVSDDELAHDGEATVVVGGIGWRETIDIERIGWNVVGNETAFVVDLTHDGETTRSFVSDSSRVDVRLANHSFAIAPGYEGFSVAVYQDGAPLETVPIPAVNDSVGVDTLVLETVKRDGTKTLYVEHDKSRLRLAEKEES